MVGSGAVAFSPEWAGGGLPRQGTGSFVYGVHRSGGPRHRSLKFFVVRVRSGRLPDGQSVASVK